jgi:hypothetical protein
MVACVSPFWEKNQPERAERPNVSIYPSTTLVGTGGGVGAGGGVGDGGGGTGVGGGVLVDERVLKLATAEVLESEPAFERTW